MKAFRAALFLASLLSAFPAFAAQTIPISDSLAANADKLNVKMGNQWFGQIAKWRIGDYAVVSSKLRQTHINTKSNLWKTKTDSTSSTRFSFVMSADPTDSVTVTAEHLFRNKSEHEFHLNKTLALGNEGLIGESDMFTALITMNADTTEKWTLVKGSTIDANGDSAFEAHLNSGEREILIAPVIATRHGGKPHHSSFFSRLISEAIPPALGYEFSENGRSVCAVQTFGGSLKRTGRVVWMRRDLEARDKLVLAAAITAILQMESSGDGGMTDPE